MNLAQILELVAKYAPTIVKIVQTDGPVIEAFLKDLQALQAGQAPSAVIPSPASFMGVGGLRQASTPPASTTFPPA